MIREAAILFLLIVAVGLLVIMWRQHPPEQVALSPLTPAAVARHGFVCVPAITPRINPVRKTEAFT